MDTSPRFDVEVHVTPDACRLELRGELDIATAPEVTSRIDELLGDGADPARAIVIDLRGVSFIDSTGLRALVAAEKALHGVGGQLTLIPGPEQVQRVFELVQLDKHFTFDEPPAGS